MKTRYIGKKTWFCKDTQKWVSEVPRAFWLGIHDKNNEKIYSDEHFIENDCNWYNYNGCTNATNHFIKYGDYFYYWAIPHNPIFNYLHKYEKK